MMKTAVIVLLFACNFAALQAWEVENQLFHELLRAAELMRPENSTYKAHAIWITDSQASVEYQQEVHRLRVMKGLASSSSQLDFKTRKESVRNEGFVHGKNMVRYTQRVDSIEVKAVNQQYGFAVSWRKSENTAELLNLFIRGEDAEIDRMADYQANLLFVNLPGLWNVFLTPIPDLLASKQFKMNQIIRVSTDGRDLVRVDFDHIGVVVGFDRPAIPSMKNGYWISDPNLEWAVIECGFVQLDDDGQNTLKPTQAPLLTRTINYSHNRLDSGRPVLTHIRSFSTFIDKPLAIEVVDTKYETGSDFDPAVFMISYYGLPEPRFGGSVGLWVLYGLIGVALISLGVWVRRKCTG